VKHYNPEINPDSVELLALNALELQRLRKVLRASWMPVAKILVFLFLLVTPVSAALVAESTPSAASKEDKNKAVARRVFDEIFNQGRFEVADEIYAPDFVNHGLTRNISLREDQDAVHQEKAAFPDLKMSVQLMVAEGDLVTVVWIFRGTHTHAGYGGLPPTGAKIEFRGITVWRIVDGRIYEEWTAFDLMRPFSQFVSQRKWPLAGLFLAALILGWGSLRGLQHLLGKRRRAA
jgi:steroid delta-isomerase-like uncharacterized protein